MRTKETYPKVFQIYRDVPVYFYTVRFSVTRAIQPYDIVLYILHHTQIIDTCSVICGYIILMRVGA